MQIFPLISQTLPNKKGQPGKIQAAATFLLLAEGLAVGALILGGIHLVGTHQNLVQRAVVLAGAVISALLNGAFDALVCIVVHNA